MKLFSFAALLAVLVVLSCNGENNVTGGDSNGSGSAENCVPAPRTHQCYKESNENYIKNYINYEKLDPSCRNEQKKLITIIDSSFYEIDWDYIYSHLPDYSHDDDSGPPKMNNEEYNEYERKYEEELSKHTRELSIPCIVRTGVALLTDEEIVELIEKYDKLAFEEFEFPELCVEDYSGITYCEE